MRWCAMSLGLLVAASAQAQSAVGRTEGEAGVTTTGSARYSIPLALPPGTNGLAPSLAIDYDSRADTVRFTGDAVVDRLGDRMTARIGAVLSARYVIEAVNDGADLAFAQAEALEATLFGVSAGTADAREGTRAFLEKRKAEWTGQ